MFGTTESKKELLTGAEWYTACWNYFSLLSGQRMQMLEFFISLEIFLVGAFITLISLAARLRWAEITVSVLIVLMAIVFRCFDQRTKTMIHECENSMIAIEEADASSESFKPITAVNTKAAFKITYTKLISALQIVFLVAGLASSLLVLCNVI